MNPDAILAIGVVITSITGLVTVVLSYKARTGIKEVHTMANSRQDRMEARIEQLGDSLRNADIAVPNVPEKESL